MSVRVVHWSANFGCGGGVANAVLGLAEAQARLGAEVWIAAMKASEPPLYEPMAVDSGVTLIEWLPRYPVSRGWRFHAIRREDLRRLRGVDPDVVHVHGEFNPDNLWVPRLYDAPIILSPHGGFHPEVLRRGRRATRALYVQLAKRVLYRRVQAFHALCPAEREHIRRVLPGARVYCVAQGPSVRVHPPQPRAASVGAPGCVRFLFVGRQDVFTKGLDLLLEAFALAHHQSGGRNLTLTMAGADWNGGTAWLRLRAAELGVGHAVSFAGSMPGRDIAALLERSDIYVQMSRHDGLPLSVSEALLAGKPVILSDAVGTASHVEIASLPHVRIVSLSVCEIAGAMTGFVRSLGRLRMIAARHRTQIGHFFSWERIAAAQLAAYRDQRSARSPSASSACALSMISKRARERRWTW